jgi:hypothetical protein
VVASALKAVALQGTLPDRMHYVYVTAYKLGRCGGVLIVQLTICRTCNLPELQSAGVCVEEPQTASCFAEFSQLPSEEFHHALMPFTPRSGTDPVLGQNFWHML